MADTDTTVDPSADDIVNNALDAAAEWVSELPAGERAWNKKTFGIAEVAARSVVAALNERLRAAEAERDELRQGLEGLAWLKEKHDTANERLIAMNEQLTAERDALRQSCNERLSAFCLENEKVRTAIAERDAARARLEAAERMAAAGKQIERVYQHYGGAASGDVEELRSAIAAYNAATGTKEKPDDRG